MGDLHEQSFETARRQLLDALYKVETIPERLIIIDAYRKASSLMSAYHQPENRVATAAPLNVPGSIPLAQSGPATVNKSAEVPKGMERRRKQVSE